MKNSSLSWTVRQLSTAKIQKRHTTISQQIISFAAVLRSHHTIWRRKGIVWQNLMVVNFCNKVKRELKMIIIYSDRWFHLFSTHYTLRHIWRDAQRWGGGGEGVTKVFMVQAWLTTCLTYFSLINFMPACLQRPESRTFLMWQVY